MFSLRGSSSPGDFKHVLSSNASIFTKRNARAQLDLCRTFSKITLLVFPRGGTNFCIFHNDEWQNILLVHSIYVPVLKIVATGQKRGHTWMNRETTRPNQDKLWPNLKAVGPGSSLCKCTTVVICNHGPQAPGNSGVFDFWSSKSLLKSPNNKAHECRGNQSIAMRIPFGIQDKILGLKNH